MKIKVRTEVAEDHNCITRVNDLAFEQDNESILITKLRDTNEFIPELSLVAEVNNEVVGHILFYPVPVVDGKTNHTSLSLAPMSVLPEYQNKGIGSELIKVGLEKARQLGYKNITVLGHPEYYPKFGFEKASKWNISAPFEYPDEALMAIELVENGMNNISGSLEFPAAYFDAL